jgi:hypothetical protein
MFLSPFWAIPICATLALFKPLENTLGQTNVCKTHSERWLLFFLCASLTIIPLHLVSFFGCGVPFRWELSTLLTLVYSYDDARGAQAVFLHYIRSAILKLSAPLVDMRQRFDNLKELHYGSINPSDAHPHTLDPTTLSVDDTSEAASKVD